MTAAGLIAALGLPAGARVGHRVPKKLLVEQGAPTAADKRRIDDGIEEVQWVAALKPTTIGVPAFRDDAREYLEIAVLSTAFRVGAKASRLEELIHRAVPYPVLLLAAQGERLTVSAAHKRWSQGEAGATVLEGDVVTAGLKPGEPDKLGQAFQASLALSLQPRAHLFALYQGWMDALLALLAARMTGAFVVADTPDHAAARQQALRECARLDAEIIRLQAAATKEKQLARHVALNLELKRLEQRRSAARQRL